MKNCGLPSAPTLSDGNAILKQITTATIYEVTEYKSFFDSRKPDQPAANREFCGNCLKPCRILDDDLDDILSKSDFCQCKRRGHA